MTDFIEYEIYCEDEDTRFHVVREESDAAPTVCPNNGAHTVQVQIDRRYSQALQVDSEGRAEVTGRPPLGNELYGYSWNYCDESGWVEDATLHTVEMRDKQVAGNREWDTSPDGIDPADHINWIDIQHGRLPMEDDLTRDYDPVTGNDTGVKAEWADYIPVVKVLPNGQADEPGNWVTKTEDVDFYIDYNAGEIIFNSDLTSGDRVKATFRKSCGTYKWTFLVPAGKKVKAVYAEAHGTDDFVITGWVRREVWAYNPGDLPNKMIYNRSTYKTFLDLMLTSTGAFPRVPAAGGASMMGNFKKRGLDDQGLLQIPFDYVAVTALKASEGAEYRITLEKKWDGTWASLVLYCQEEDEG